MRKVKLPPRVTHEVPMPLKADGYTVNSELFASDKAKKKSVYYITFRRVLEKINPHVFSKGDNRIIFHGISRLIEDIFYVACNMKDIDETESFLSKAQVTTQGLTMFDFPRHLWERIVNEFNGRPPISIYALKEGSIVYPNEPCVRIESEVEGFGEFAAWFESTLLKVWASSEFITTLVHWKEYWKSLIKTVYGNTKTADEIEFMASLCLFNFGCRAGMTNEESRYLGEDFLLIFNGSDTLMGAYQAWKNSGETPGVFTTVPALAHRNVQAYDNEEDCYKTMYDVAKPGAILSMVSDCYSSYDATEKYLYPLAKHAAETGNGKVIIDRFDSGDAKEQVLWLCKFAHKHGLSVVEKILNKEWRFGTTLKFFEGDGMTYQAQKEINEELMLHGFPPFAWGVPYGQGGGCRNDLKRDNLSAKYALSAIGDDYQGVCKFSETLEKTTLPGKLKVLRSPEALASKKTIVMYDEPGADALVPYFNGADIWEPFKEGFGEGFLVKQKRIIEEMKTMPLTLTTEENHNYPCSDKVRNLRLKLLKKYAPKKLAQNY